MSNILLTQPGGVGELTADGFIQVGVRCYLSAVGVTAASWVVLSKPTGSTATARLHSRNGWYFDPDVTSTTPYVIQMTDTLSATHTNSFTACVSINGVPHDAGRPVYAAWYGVKEDAVQYTDCVRQAGSAKLTRSAGGFSRSMLGAKVLIREPDPASKAAGSVTIGSTGNNVGATGAGTNLAVDMPTISGAAAGEPASGGCIFVGNAYYTAILVDASAGPQTLLLAEASATQTSQPWYTQTQRAMTVSAFVSETEVTLSDVAPVDQSSVPVTIATDDTVAIKAAWQSALLTGARRVVHLGLAGISSNIGFTSVSGLTIEGLNPSTCGFVDLRTASTQSSYPNPDNYYGAISWVSCTRIRMVNLSYDGNVPVNFMVHSAGGTLNASGSRSGFVFYNCDDCHWDNCWSLGYGARDEHLYAQGCTNTTAERCRILLNNNVSINFNSGGTGNAITDCVATYILGASDSFLVSRNVITSSNHARREAYIVYGNAGHIVISDNIIQKSIHATTGTGMIKAEPGATDANATLDIVGNTITNCDGVFSGVGTDAIIEVNDHYGTVTVCGNTIDKCTGSAGARFIGVKGSNIASVTIGGNTLRGRAGSNMTVGIEVESTVPAGKVKILGDNVFGESVTTKWSLSKGVETPTFLGQPLQGTNLGDTSPSLTVAGGSRYVLPENTLTNNRSATLGTAGATTGEVVEIERRDVNNFTYAVINGGGGAGTKYTFPALVKRTARFKFDGVDWQLHEHTKIDG